MRAVRAVLATMDALWQLARLAMVTRGKLRGRYWTWRHETAFGTDPSCMPGFAERVGAVLRFGHWVGRMRRLQRG
jgi:hypothetical protein